MRVPGRSETTTCGAGEAVRARKLWRMFPSTGLFGKVLDKGVVIRLQRSKSRGNE